MPSKSMRGVGLLGQCHFVSCRLTGKIDSRHTNSSRFKFNSWGRAEIVELRQPAP